MPPRPRSRGCLGCLGCLPRLILVLAVGCVLVLGITAVFDPWGFYLGGKFHIIPDWQGWGTLHAKSGNYVVWVHFWPRPARSHIYPRSHVFGVAYLCSPRGETFRMRLGGSMRRGIGLNTDGETISLYMHKYAGFLGNDYRPGIELRGEWHNPNLVMDDHSSIYRAFRPDGTVDRGQRSNQPYMDEIVPVTLVPGSYSDFQAGCKTP